MVLFRIRTLLFKGNSEIVVSLVFGWLAALRWLLNVELSCTETTVLYVYGTLWRSMMMTYVMVNTLVNCGWSNGWMSKLGSARERERERVGSVWEVQFKWFRDKKKQGEVGRMRDCRWTDWRCVLVGNGVRSDERIRRRVVSLSKWLTKWLKKLLQTI